VTLTAAQLEQPPLRRYDAWSHQCAAFHFAHDRPAALLAMGMGTGKSKVTIDLNVNRGWPVTLILCPKSVLGVWRREHDRHWPVDEQDLAVLVLDKGTCKAKAERLDKFMRLNNSTVKVAVANYDAAWREPLGDALLQAGFFAAVGDELHRAKAPGGKASRWMQKLGRVTKRRLGLTGTPMPHSPLDLYAQFRFLDPSIFGTSFTRFRSRYAINNPMFPSQIRQWINQEELTEKFESITYQCKSDDVLDLPDCIHETRYCQLEPKTQRVYHDLEKEFIAEVEAGTVTVANALTKSLRLRQVTSGFVGGRDENDTEFIQELGAEKRQLLADLLEDIGEPCVVFCEFRHDLDTVEAVCKSLGRRYGELSGRRRDAINDHAEMSGDVDVAGVQTQAGGVGIDLTRACYGVWFNLPWSLGNHQQAIARLHRPGQSRCTRFYTLMAEGTVDELVYKALERREEVVNYILHRELAA
jgi:SNF2 family DNA or RNA helicase